jgi:hypothetical protein
MPFYIAPLLAVGQKLLTAVFGPKFLEWALFKIAEEIAAHTATPHDDEFVAKIKDAYNNPSK